MFTDNILISEQEWPIVLCEFSHLIKLNLNLLQIPIDYFKLPALYVILQKIGKTVSRYREMYSFMSSAYYITNKYSL